ncbi:MAG: hypothetical protein FWG41_05110, partial [Methanomassiliicoccaceae archaeon]|nr:hypothetical protein [Methanomassiliicoccaceae archaeon]
MRLLTHVYLANLIMDELVTNKGKLRIPDVKGNYSAGTLREPYPPGNEDAPKAVRFPTRGGGIEVPEAVVKVILSNREYFRGGAAGFDAFPDSAFVREVIRPFGSGIWLEYLFDRFRALPKGEERDRVYAFLIGLMTHCSASVFMRAYANEYAGGWYDGPDKPAGKKHDLIDEFVEDALARPSSKYSVVSKEERTIDIPAHFLAVCFADMSAVEDQIKRIRPEEKSGKILSAYHGSGLDPFRNSSFDYAAADGGRGTVPDPLYPKTISERIARMEKLIEKQLNDAKKVLTGEGPEKNRAEIVKLMEEQFGEEDVPKKLLNDIKEFGEAETYPYGKEGEFKAFSLGLTASKFCIIGYKELNRYLDPDPDRPETGAFGRDESRHSLKGVRLKMEPVSDLYDFFKGGTTLCGFEISAKERKAAFSAFLPSEVREGKISIDLPFPIPYEDITGFTLFMAGGEAFWDIGGFEVASETGKVLAKTTEPFRVEQNSSCSIEVNSKAVKEKVDSMGPAEAIDVPHRIMSWLYSLDGQDRDLTEKDPEYANPDRRPWEYDEYAIYSNAKEQKEEQKEFVPGLQSDLLSDEFDDIQEKPQQKEKPVSPVTKPKPKTGIPFDPSKTP